MAIYRIIRIYDVPADNQIQATNRMMEALVLHVERDYHVMDYVKAPYDPTGKGRPVNLKPPEGWLRLLIAELVTQVTGKPKPVKDGEWVTPVVYKGKSQHTLELEADAEAEAEAEKKKKR